MDHRSPPFEPQDDWVSRRAKLLESGDYPDKGLRLDASDLHRLASAFKAPAPVLIEHASSPLQLGFLTQVFVEGEELFGEVRFSPEAHALIERSGAQSLSLGLDRETLRIREVSLVRHPRVASARLLTADVVQMDGALEAIDWRAEFSRLREAKRQAEAVRRVDDYVRSGRLLPAQAQFAAALFANDDELTFGEGESVGELLRAMIERQPPHRLFEELGPAAQADADENLFLPEEAAFYRRYFPNVPLQDIAQRKA